MIPELLAQNFLHLFAEIRRRINDVHPSPLHRFELRLRRARPAADDGAGVAHASSRRGCCSPMKPTTGFFMLALIHCAASSSAVPPISPIIITDSVPESSL